MGKKQQQHNNSDEAYGQLAGAIGTLVIAAGVLAAIKDKTGLSWPATVLLTVGALVALGYGAWRVKTTVARRWATTPTEKPSTALAQESPQEATDAAQVPVPAHPELTKALVKTGAIGKDEIIKADDVTVTSVKTGTRYEFLVPEGKSYTHVESKLGVVAGMFGVSRLHTKLERNRLNDRGVRLLVLDEPPFTTAFPPPTRQEIGTFDGVPFGHDVVGELAGAPTFDKASLLIAGMTQMGKTTLVNGLIACLLVAYGEFDLYLLDGKFCGLTRFEKIAVRYEASDDPAVFEEMVTELNGRADRRYAEMQDASRNRRPKPEFRPVFFIVDEAADFFADDGTTAGKERARRIAEKSRALVAKCLESGISTVLMTQRPSQNAIPVVVRDQFLYRICMYVASEGTAKVALGDTYFETVAPISPALLDSNIKGQGVLFAHGVSTLIRGFEFKDEFIWEVVDAVHDRQQKVLEKEPASPLKQAVDLMRDKGVDFLPTADLAPALGIIEENPAERGKKLNRLLGVASDKSTKGVRGYRLDDLTAALMSHS